MATLNELFETYINDNYEGTMSQAAIVKAYELLLGLTGNFADKAARVQYWVDKDLAVSEFLDEFLAAAARLSEENAAAWGETTTERTAVVNAAQNAVSTSLSLEEVGTVVANARASYDTQDLSLTSGVDKATGGVADDTITGVVDGTTTTNATFTALDTIDGGAGTDTLVINNISALAGDALDLSIATISNVEVISVRAVGDISNANAANVAGTNEVDFSSISGLETINTTKSVDTLIKAAATTDVNVSGATGHISVLGGKDITVNDSTADEDINIGNGAADTAAGVITVTDSNKGTGVITIDGGTNVVLDAQDDAGTGAVAIGAGKAASGTVNVTASAADTTNNAANLTMGAIGVTGGTSVTVNVDAGDTDASEFALGATVVQSAVTVTSDGNTTSVTVNQEDTQAEVLYKEAVTEVKESTVITFKDLDSGENVSIRDNTTEDTITFTASQDLTAAEVAEIFANIANNDKQTAAGVTSKGTWTNSSGDDFSAVWSSGAVSGATVTFTANDDSQNDLEFTGSTAAATPTQVKTAGTAGVAGVTGVLGKTTGAVRVDDHTTASITTVSIDGYNGADLGSTGGDLDALQTLSLANSAGTTALETAQTSLTLNVNDVDHAVNIDTGSATVKTLNLNAVTEASTFALTYAAVTSLNVDAAVALNISGSTEGALEAVDVDGAGAVNLGDISDNEDLDTFDASGNTGGVTATVEVDADHLTGNIVTNGYTFSEGNDVVTLSADAGTASEVAINLGSGDDSIDLATATLVSSTKVIDGGAGTDTITLRAVDAETATTSSTLENFISNFEKVSVGEVATTADNTVNLDNLDDISYVVSAGAADTAEVTVVTTVSTAATAVANGQTLSLEVDGTTFTYTAAGGAEDENSMLVGLAALIQADADVATAAVSGDADNATITITAATAGKMLDVGNLSGVGAAAANITTSSNAITSSELFITNMADNGTVELNDAALSTVVTMTDATGSSDTLNVVATVGDDNDIIVGTVKVDDVETININANDADLDEDGLGDSVDRDTATMYLDGDDVTTVNVTGEAHLTLGLLSDAAKVTALDASALNGNLTVTATGNSAMTVTGGAGDDALTASGSQDVLLGGDGSDTLTGADLTTMTGGAGNDTFVMSATSNVNSYSTITDFSSGDVIDLDSADAGTVAFSAAAITLADTAVFQDYANAAAQSLGTDANDATWFQLDGNTYIVQSGADSTKNDFQTGDLIIQISGLVDLGNGASYNQTYGTLELA